MGNRYVCRPPYARRPPSNRSRKVDFGLPSFLLQNVHRHREVFWSLPSLVPTQRRRRTAIVRSTRHTGLRVLASVTSGGGRRGLEMGDLPASCISPRLESGDVRHLHFIQ